MKKFTKFIVCFMLCVLSICLVACDNRTPKEKDFTYPDSNALVSGNDGLAVQKGNYIYFVNGHQSVDDMSKKNDSYTLGSLLLMKLDENGNVVRDEKELLKDEYYITMSDKLCGFEATNLFIGGDYLYFTSPCQEDEGGEGASTSPTWAKERVEVYRIKLNKTSTPEEVYQSEVSHEKLELEFYFENNKTYIVAYEKEANLDNENINNALIRVDCDAKSATQVAKDVSSVAFGQAASEVFYVASAKNENKTTYKLNQFNVVENKSTEFTSKDSTFKVEAVGGGNVFISQAKSGSTGLYKASINPKTSFNDMPEITSIDKLDKYYISEDGYCFVGIDGTKIKVKTTDGQVSKTIEDSDAEEISFIGFVNGNIVYKDKANNVKIVNYYNYLNGTTYTIETIDKITDANTTYFDLDNSHLYFYKKVGEHEYLHRLSLTSRYEEDKTQSEMIGVYLEDDIPEVEESETTEE